MAGSGSFQDSCSEPMFTHKRQGSVDSVYWPCSYYSPYQDAIMQVQSLEQSFAYYHSIQVEKLPDGQVKLVQKHIIDHFLNWWKYKSIMLSTPKPMIHLHWEILHKDPQGSDCKHAWNYHAVIGDLTYLTTMTHPELDYTVQCTM